MRIRRRILSRAGEPRSPLVWVAAFCLLGYAERSLADGPCPPGMQVPAAFQCVVKKSEINIDFRGELDEGEENTVFVPKIPEDFPKGPVTINFNNYGRIVGVIQNSDSPSSKPLKFNYRQKGGKSSFAGKIGLDRSGYCLINSDEPECTCLSNPDAPECAGDSVSVEESSFVGEIAINRGSVKFIKSSVRGYIDGDVIIEDVTITLRDSEVCSPSGFIIGTPDQKPKVIIEGIVLVEYCGEPPSAGDDDTSFIPELKDGAALLRSRREYEDRKTLEMALANGDKVGFATDSLAMRMLPADLAISQRLAAISAAQLGYADFAPNDTAPIGAFASLWLKSIYANGWVGARQRQRNSSTLLGVDWAWDGDWNSGFSLGFTHNGDKLTQMGTLKSRGYMLSLYNSKAIRGRALSVESLFIYSRQGNRLASHLPGFIGSGKFASHTLYGRNTIGLNFRPRERLVVTPYIGVADYFILRRGFAMEAASAYVYASNSSSHDALLGVRVLRSLRKSSLSFAGSWLRNVYGRQTPFLYRLGGIGPFAYGDKPSRHGFRLGMSLATDLGEKAKLELGAFSYKRGDYRQLGGSLQLKFAI